ncbi:hypothetical protein C8F01DRAFT_638125 [Mycena amicta]|nr:hypothetical protein C8F01DRAFT_638125 [Mycena amicta]
MLPNELILEIFKNVSRHELLSSASASHKFCQLARTFLFTKLHFMPYALQDGVLRLPPEDDVLELIHKLTFFASPAIAPLVRSVYVNRLSMSPSYTGPMMSRGIEKAEFDLEEGTHALLDLFFRFLDKFEGLTTLCAAKIPFTQNALESLARVHAPLKLEIIFCSLSPGLTLTTNPGKLRIRHFDICKSPDTDLWLSLIDPNALHEIEIFGVRDFPRHNLRPFPVFPHVWHMVLLLRWENVAVDLPVLKRAFPGVRELNFQASYSTPDPYLLLDELPRVFPVLETIEAPHESIPIFLPGTLLQKLHLEMCDSDELLLALERAGAHFPKTIRTLDMSMHSRDNTTLTMIFAYFPVLEDLELVIYTYGLDDDTLKAALAFLSILPSILPRTLTRLNINYDLEGDSEEVSIDSASFDIPNPRALHGQLMARCPDLTTIWLGGLPKFSLGWSVEDGFDILNLVGNGL